MSFVPPPLLRHHHTQSLLASTPPRKFRVMRRTRRLRAEEKLEILECDDGVKLECKFNLQPRATDAGMVILIHGWEGSADSNYILSSADAFYRAGYSVARLNLPDHGTSHHLNTRVFNSTMLPEVVSAVRNLQQRYPHPRFVMAGFSLGGNFALRVAASAPANDLVLEKVAAVCPPLDPSNTMRALDSGWWVYERYFALKWRRSLRRKQAHFPDLNLQEGLRRHRRLRAMNEYFVPRFTHFRDTESYFNAYAVTGDALEGLTVPCHIILAADDPIVVADDAGRLARSENLTVEITDHGGHCGFFHNFRMDSWIDERLLTLLA